MKVQLLITAMVVGVCVGLPVKPEPRKFVYQVGYPSVRRYPVYPDRLLNIDQPQIVLKMAVGKNKDIKNELVPLDGKKPEVMQPKMSEKPQTVNFMHREETSTNPWVPVEIETTTTYRPPVTTTPEASSSSPSLFEETAFTPLILTFTPQPQPSSFESESSISSSTSFFGPTSPILTLFSPDSNNSVEPATPEGPTLPEGPIAPEPISSSFGVFTEVPEEESTDTPMTTVSPRNELMEEERMADPTIPPQEEAGEFEELSENNTETSLLEQTVTEAGWDPVTQEIYTTEEIEAF